MPGTQTLPPQLVQDLASEGFGVVRPHNAPVVLVPFTLPGEVVEITITRRKRQLWYGQAVAWHRRSPHRVEPHCGDFGRCGGCRWQMMDYPYQLHYKQRFVQQAFSHLGHLTVEVPPVVPSPLVWHYRNKAEYTFGEDPPGHLLLGFHPRGDFARVLDLTACQIVPPAFEAVRRTVLAQARLKGLRAYHPLRHKGLLRQLIVRGTEDRLIAFLSLADDRPDVALDLLGPVQASLPLLAGFGYFHNPKRNDSLTDLNPIPLAGDTRLEFCVDGLQYELGIQDFFQVNLPQAENLLRWIRERLPPRCTVLYDLYGGVGFFGVGLADRAEKVVLVEKLPQAVRSAEANFRRNRHRFPTTTWQTYTGALEDLTQVALTPPPGSVAIVDPPREGLHPTVRKALRTLPFEEIFYVSCHPATQARDLADLQEAYQIVAVQPFDLFPHTTSVENIAHLRRIKRPTF